MSAFLEEYGKIIVVIIVIAALIVLAVTFKNRGSATAETSFNSFTGAATGAAANAASQVH